MAFVQTVEVEATDEAGLRDHLAGWHAEQAGLAPATGEPGFWPRRPRQAGT